jgi:hypothetical protein
MSYERDYTAAYEAAIETLTELAWCMYHNSPPDDSERDPTNAAQDAVNDLYLAITSEDNSRELKVFVLRSATAAITRLQPTN